MSYVIYCHHPLSTAQYPLPTIMAYTFTDHYRAVRIILRIDGLVVGVGLGTLLLIYPTQLFTALGFAVSTISWPARIGGSSLLGLGIGLIVASSEPELRVASLLAATFSNGLIALSLFIAYFQGEFAGLSPWGVLILLFVFVICLLTTVLPIPYVRGIQRLE